MGKVTVKHYLEKKVKPTTIYREVVAYPVYIRITVNRKTTQIRSLTEALMSEDAFNTYCHTGVFDHKEAMMENSVNISLDLSKEINLIELCMETITKLDCDYDFSDRNIRNLISILLTSAIKALINTAWSKETYADNSIDAFIGSFNKEISLINSVKNFQDVLDVDITRYLPIEYFKMWQVVEMVKCLGVKEMPFVEFIGLDYNKLLIDTANIQSTKEYCLITDNNSISNVEIVNIASNLIQGYLSSI